MPQLASIIIPNYNGKDLLSECLPSVVQAVDVKVGHEIIVVDDGSTDGSTEFIKLNFPMVTVLQLDSNQGFGAACNQGVEKSKNPLVVLLNTDIQVKRDFLAPLTESFQSHEVFAVSAKVYWWNRNDSYVERTVGSFKRGILQISSVPVTNDEKKNGPCPALYAGGGMAAFDRDKFLALGGFDGLFDPFYGEDLDLSYRAWKKGWKVLYEPRSVMYHKHAATIKKVSSSLKIKVIKNRNMFLFIWKNITIFRFLLIHLIWLPIHLLVWTFTLRPTATLGFIWALTKLGKVVGIRMMENRKKAILTDSEIFALTCGNAKEKTIREGLKKIFHRHWERFHTIRMIEWEAICSWLDPKKQEKIADVGCGNGYFARVLARKGCLVWGIDIDSISIKNATKYNKDENCFFTVGSAMGMPYRSTYFDKVISVCCLEHITDDEEALREIYRVLKPGGTLVLSVDAYNSRWIQGDFKQQCKKAFSIERFYDIDRFRAKLEDLGFTCQRHKYIFNSKLSYYLFRFVLQYERLRYLFLSAFPLLYLSSKVFDHLSKCKDGGFILIVKAKKGFHNA